MRRLFICAGATCALAAATLPASAEAAIYHVVGTGGTLHVRTAPNLSAPIVGNLPDGTAIDIVCQTRGDQVVGSTMWDKIDQPTNGYVADWYTTTPVVNNPSPGLPGCGSPPPPPPAPPPPPQGAGGHGEYVNQAHNLCMDAAGQSDGSNGGRTQLWSCWGGVNQQWAQVGNELVNQAHGLCLDASAQGDGSDGDPVSLWSCWGGANQQWVRVGNELVNQAHGLCLDAAAQADGSNGDSLQLWSCNGQPQQQWPVWHHYRIELKAWIPQPYVADPWDPALNPATVIGTADFPCGGLFTTSRFAGDNYTSFTGGTSARGDRVVNFDWNGSQIQNFSTYVTLGVTHRAIAWSNLVTSGGCTVQRTASDSGYAYPTSSSGLTLAMQTSNPLVPGAPAIHAVLNLGIASNGTLNVGYQSTFFPSIGFQVTRDASSPLTDVVNDASCLSNDAVLGYGGLAKLSIGLLNFNNKGTATILPGATGQSSQRDWLLC